MEKRRPWTDEEKALLAKIYPDTPTEECARILRRAKYSVFYMANKMHLRKSAAFHEAGLGGRIPAGVRFNPAGEFKKGQTGWNKGKKGLSTGGEKTWFKKGQRPHNQQPLGAERLTKEGYLQRKVRETGYPPRDWVEVHRLLWEYHNGPIPEGYVIRFRDGNPKNIVIGNLELISQAENVIRNSIQRYPPELKSVMRAVGKLNKGIKKYEQEHS